MTVRDPDSRSHKLTTTPNDDWFADEAFWETTFPFMFTESRLAAADEEVGQVLAHARERAHRAAQNVEWVRDDMRVFVRPNRYDLAISLFTSFGFFRDDADNRQVLANVATSLRPGGVFVLDMIGKETLARIFAPTGSHEIPGGVVVHRRRVVDDWCRVSNDWIVLQGDHAKTFRFSHWIYSGREIREMLLGAGFGEAAVYGDLEGSPYGVEAARLVVVGRKV